MRLELSKCVVRPMQFSDAVALAKHGNNPKVAINTSLPSPMSIDTAQQWLKIRLEQSSRLFCAIEVDGAVGAISLIFQSEPKHHSAEIGYWLGEEYWNKGIMTEAVQALTEYGFSERNLSRIYAHVFSWNTASMRVLEKGGYQREGWLRQSVVKDGKVVDEAFYARLRDASVPLAF